MAEIQPLTIEEALRPRSRPAGPRTLRRQALERDAQAVSCAVVAPGAAQVDISDEERPDRYLAGLRTTVARMGFTDILLQKRRNAPAAVAWRMREEGRPHVEARQRTLGDGAGAKLSAEPIAAVR